MYYLELCNNHLRLEIYDETATILRDIEWNTSGLTSIFDEVDIRTISKATLHNLSYIKSLELGIGDEIDI